jgi:hypothetical protein
MSYWLMIYLSAWVHVFGTYNDVDECMRAGRAATGYECGVPPPIFSGAPRCSCVPLPRQDHQH